MTTAAPRVTVIIPTYNWSGVLKFSIESVLLQSFRDFELLVVGDGCTDDSEAVVRGFGDPRIRWHNLPQNSGGQSLPNNAGLAMARGDYVAYLGHDDLWHSSHLELLVGTMDEHHADFAHTICLSLGPPGSNVRTIPFTPQRTNTPPSSIMHRRDLMNRIAPWQDYRTMPPYLAPDMDFVHRAGHAGKTIQVLRLTVFKFPATWRRDSYIHKPTHEQAEYLRRMKTEPDFLERELTRALIAYAMDYPKYPPGTELPPQPADAGPGWLVTETRKLRGLER